MKTIKYWFLVMLLAPLGVQAATVNVWVDPADSGSYNIGDSFTLGIWANWDIDHATGGVALEFDPNVVEVVGGEIIITAMGDWSETVTVDNTNGIASPIAFFNFGTPPGTHQIATVDMVAVGIGTSLLSLSDPAHYAFPWLAGFDGSGQPIPVAFNATSGTVSVVPLPAAVWFMLSGLGFLAFRSRRSAQS
ncbi:MAG: VPLPA-CTERM sorting domain-containing protein [Candidatus Polarisedimenticolaceae bacterium]|nr:VPLPA-CTERM sorting domain-containing protein [Candidatus Polarisedimenticolaceae bacterium]